MKKRVKSRCSMSLTEVRAKSKISLCNFFPKNYEGQVWIETVIYTLIALIMIGAVLSWGKPKIEELQDKSIIEQTIGVLENIDSQISSAVQGGPGNKRLIDIGLKKGQITIDGMGDTIKFEMETRYVYSELGQEIYIGNVMAYTVKKGELNIVTLKLDYKDKYDLQYQGNSDGTKTITKSSTPYRLSISNVQNAEGVIIDTDLI